MPVNGVWIKQRYGGYVSSRLLAGELTINRSGKSN
jgi:hypothetical protein